MEHIDITVPDQWNAEQDFSYYLRFYPSAKVTDAQLAITSLDESRALYLRTLDNALVHLLPTFLPEESAFVAPMLELDQKLKLLRESSLRRQVGGPSLVSRYCDMNYHYDRLVYRFLHTPRNVWVRELLDMAVRLLSIAVELDDSMTAIDPDYRRVFSPVLLRVLTLLPSGQSCRSQTGSSGRSGEPSPTRTATREENP